MENPINGKISFLVSEDKTRIEVQDALSSITFLTVELTNDQLASMLSRIAYTPCEISVNGLDRVGKKMEHRQFEFEYLHRDSLKLDCETAMINEGLVDWMSDHYYGSQNTFSERSGKNFAKTTIRRWT